jgi:hypothetical protein
MNAINPMLELETDALRAILQPCAIVSRPIPYPSEHEIGPIGGQR